MVLAGFFFLTVARPGGTEDPLSSIRDVTIPITRTGPYEWQSEPLAGIGHPALSMDWSIGGLPNRHGVRGEADVGAIAMGIRTTPQGAVFEVRFRVTSFEGGARFVVHSVQRERDTGGC
jgi:hypothetical protein